MSWSVGSSVTKFATFLTFKSELEIFWRFIEKFGNICAFCAFFVFWAIFHSSKWPNIGQLNLPSGHTESWVHSGRANILNWTTSVCCCHKLKTYLPTYLLTYPNKTRSSLTIVLNFFLWSHQIEKMNAF